MNEFKIEEEFNQKPLFHHLQVANKKELEETANKLGYNIDYSWHPSYSKVFGETKGILKKILFQESLILHDLNSASSIYEKFEKEAKENPEFKKNVKTDFKKLNERLDKEGETDELSRNAQQDDLDIFHEGELQKIADQKMFERYGGVIFYNTEQEKEYKKIMKWGYLYHSEAAHLVHLKNITSGQPKVLLLLPSYMSKVKPKINVKQINETQWKKYLDVIYKNLEKE